MSGVGGVGAEGGVDWVGGVGGLINKDFLGFSWLCLNV